MTAAALVEINIPFEAVQWDNHYFERTQNRPGYYFLRSNINAILAYPTSLDKCRRAVYLSPG